MEIQDTPDKLSRRNWLRDAAIATTGAVVVPSLLIGCEDHRIPPDGGVGDELTPAELELYGLAAENLVRMRLWYDDLFSGFTNPYIFTVYTTLKGGTVPPPTWKDISLDVFINLGIKVLEAAVAEIPGAGAAIGIVAEEVKKWALGPIPDKNIDNKIGVFADGYGNQHATVSNNLLLLSSSTDHYKHLREAFKGGDIDFNGKKYTLKDLAQNHFPAGDDPADTANYEALREAAYIRFKKYIWNVILVETAETTWRPFQIFNFQRSPAAHARYIHYPANPATYMRGFYIGGHTDLFDNYAFYLSVDGKELSPEAAHILFKDDTPGNIINPDGLFFRDYVFKQFRKERYDFKGTYDVRRDLTLFNPGPNGTPDEWNKNYDPSADDYKFTGGDL